MPIALEEQKCGLCKFWTAAPEEAFADAGLCRESPPMRDHFPKTRETTWCGHWKESSPELLARNKAAKPPEPASPEPAAPAEPGIDMSKVKGL